MTMTLCPRPSAPRRVLAAALAGTLALGHLTPLQAQQTQSARRNAPAAAKVTVNFVNADIEAVAGTPLFRAGGRLRGECPLCGASHGKKAGGAFSVEPKARWFKCFGCGEGGDVYKFIQQLDQLSFTEAVEKLAARIGFAGWRHQIVRWPNHENHVASQAA